MVDRRVQTALEGLWEILAKSNKPMSPSKGRGYAVALAELSIEEVEAACLIAARRCTWFPMPAELIEFVRGTESQKTEVAWLELQRALDAYGSHHEIMIADPALALTCLLYTSPSPRDKRQSRMPSSA